MKRFEEIITDDDVEQEAWLIRLQAMRNPSTSEHINATHRYARGRAHQRLWRAEKTQRCIVERRQVEFDQRPESLNLIDSPLVQLCLATELREAINRIVNDFQPLPTNIRKLRQKTGISERKMRRFLKQSRRNWTRLAGVTFRDYRNHARKQNDFKKSALKGGF